MSDETTAAIRELTRTLILACYYAGQAQGPETIAEAIASWKDIEPTKIEVGQAATPEEYLTITDDYLKLAYSHLSEALARLRGQYPPPE